MLVGGLKKARLGLPLVAGQISLSLLLLICAGLFIRSFSGELASMKVRWRAG
jgi:hypothetical protein